MSQSAARDDRDIFRLAPSIDAPVLQMIAARLERATDEGGASNYCTYLARHPSNGNVEASGGDGSGG